MTEHDVVARTGDRPVTAQALTADLRVLGVREGDVLVVHSSLSSLGWVVGGAAAAVRALQDAVGPGGTLSMPAHSGDLSDPSGWGNPPVPEAWWPTIRAHMPPFDADLTPTRSLGQVPELFRRAAGVRRSAHPQVSFAAWGTHAEAITADHGLAHGLGEGSPLARLYELDARVLLLGVDHAANTSLHLAEHRVGPRWRRPTTNRVPVEVGDDGLTRWAEVADVDLDEEDFVALGADLEARTDLVTVGTVGRGAARLMDQRPVVDHAVRWMEANRKPFGAG